MLRRTPGGPDPVATALDPRSFPALALPVWVARSRGLALERAFHVALACSSLHGYHFIRLIDNVMDRDGPPELAGLLPVLAVFHSGFERGYRSYFPVTHPFWRDYDRLWQRAAFATAEDAFLDSIDAPTFRTVSGLKFTAGAVPVAGVAHRGARPSLLSDWQEFIERLSCWYQMVNDVFDWHHDAGLRIRTYFLSEGERRCRPGEPLAGWVAREGLAWAVDWLDRGMDDLERRAVILGARDAARFLDERRSLVRAQLAEAAEGLGALQSLVAAFS